MLEKHYSPKDTEDAIYQRWERSGFFNPDVCIDKGIADKDAKHFSIVLPPPNVTGTLHLGHASMLAIEDTLVRFHRMRGKRTLWLPGTDHAAIATQEKVEKILWNDEGKTRHDLGREAFLQKVADFAQESHDTIVNQCKKMGASLDWSREAFTLDEARNHAVNTAFKQMYDDGLIYRGARIVNWDPNLHTTVSDDEVERKEEQASFYYLQYGPFEIGTARPETKFGDKYVVMHPEDARYKEYEHGQQIELEWINGPVTATIIKDEAIDMDFGTGVMTITPWHDATDYDIAQRHDLEAEQIIDFDGKLLPIAGDFAGMPIAEAREQIVARFKEKGLLTRVDTDYVHNAAVNSRGGGVIEPQIKEQWFVDVNKEFTQDGKTVTLKSLMQDAVRDGLIDILPEHFEKTYFHWIDNLRDWCISRQIWYGHRIPVWYRTKGTETEIYCGTEAPEGEGWKQDPDTLDTWFSSGLWTFSTLGWPDMDAKDVKGFHPTTVLETGYDILFFWVARMILMSRYLLNGEVPFKTVYLHGLVRDEQGRKMSKSLGNIINPLDVSAKFGTDAVRLALIIGTTPGNDVRLSEEKIEGYRNFANKLWNIGRYVLGATDNSSASSKASANTQPTTDDRKDLVKTAADAWIVAKLAETTTKVTEHLENYQLSAAGELLRDFTWNDFADWYVEVHKSEKNDALLQHVFVSILKLWHPFMPFVTETLWQEMHGDEELLMIEQWPTTNAQLTMDSEQVETFEAVKEIITTVRTIRATYKVMPGQPIDITLLQKTAAADITALTPLIERLAKVGIITCTTNDTHPQECAAATLGAYKLYVHLSGIIDVAQEKQRLEAELQTTQKYIAGIEKRLANEQFISKAPEHVVAGEKENHAAAQKKAEELAEYIANLSA